MRKANIILSIGGLALIWSAAGAQNMNESKDERMIRSIHSKSASLPDGVAFQFSLVSFISLSKEDPVFANAWIQETMGLDEAGAEQLITTFSTTLEQITADTERSNLEIACTSGVPRVYGDNTYLALEQMDDAGEAIAESHYLRVKNTIGEDVATRLQGWIEEQKLNIVYAKFDHKEASYQRGIGGYERLAKICEEQKL